MRIAVITLGTRGDVQPYVALCSQLVAQGHEAMIITSREFQGFVEEHGIQFGFCGLERVEQPPEWLTCKNFLEVTAATNKQLASYHQHLGTALLERCQEFKPNVIIVMPLSFGYGKNIAEKLGCACWMTMFHAGISSAYYGPHGYVPNAGWLTRKLNMARHYWNIMALLWATRNTMIKMFAEWRRDVLKMPHNSAGKELELYRLPTFLAVSPAVFPVAPDYKPEVFTTGFWFLDGPKSSLQTDPKYAQLCAFLANRSDPPVCVNFGSMIAGGGQSEFISRIVRVVVHQLHRRCMLIAGWNSFGNEFQNMPDRVCCIQAVPHELVFPSCAAVVYHGGSGTAARVIQAGVPSVIIPVLPWSDQPHFGAAVETMQCGVMVRNPTSESEIADAIARAAEPNGVLTQGAKRAAAVLAKDPGVLGAIQALEGCLCQRLQPVTNADVRMCQRNCLACRLAPGGSMPGWVKFRRQEPKRIPWGLMLCVLLVVLLVWWMYLL